MGVLISVVPSALVVARSVVGFTARIGPRAGWCHGPLRLFPALLART